MELRIMKDKRRVFVPDFLLLRISIEIVNYLFILTVLMYKDFCTEL